MLKTTEAAGTLNVKIKQSYFDMFGKQNPVLVIKYFTLYPITKRRGSESDGI